MIAVRKPQAYSFVFNVQRLGRALAEVLLPGLQTNLILLEIKSHRGRSILLRAMAL
jgi:hypothetical protein